MKNLIKPKIKTNWLYIIIIILIASFIIGGILIYQYQWWPLKEIEENRLTRSSCLTSDEIADFDYIVGLYDSTGVKLPSNAITTIFIKDKNTNEELFRFTIKNVPENSSSLEIHRCGVYVIRDIYSDIKKGIYKTPQFWRYTYDGEGNILINETDFYPYSPIPRIDPEENYLALSRYYLGHPDEAVIVKNLKTPQLDDVLIIRPDDLWRKLPQLNKERDIEAIGWSSDGKYLWGGSQSQTDTAYFRININDKNKETLEVFPMPDDAIHHGPPRLDTGYIWYNYGPPWVGFYELSEKIWDEWKQAGNKNTLFLYNLFTKEKIKLAEIDDPAWNFRPKWTSDTELEYYVPPNEKKIYKIKVESAILGRASISYFLSGDSPAELLVTDPLGRRLGKDPITNIEYNEIPGGSYYQEGIGNPFAETPTPTKESKFIWIPQPLSGKYDIKVIGTDTGNYVLETSAYDKNGNSKDITYQGGTAVNIVQAFELNYSKEDIQEIEAYRIIDIDIKPGSYPNSINFESEGVIPVAVLTNPFFDAKDIVIDSVVFARAKPERGNLEDVDNDGDLDLILHFKTQSLQLTPSDAEIFLIGKLTDNTAIKGSDSVRIINK